ncbi:Xylose import ATP-binding protein XylG [Labrenzia sp. THAF82]|uniref:sugar ABC transporter ATP-binding protein n=1 Tax=Labrenzia sp. THAF82 TaxID=2587861 RepID=UPI00126927EB|nr:sugar ABC transporter ATP-binding protein [Labrenzia sp. THAF82]QFT34076.1 Xylose import ATP-binding protein XylG [Labrenzia sp. THAF82]
MGRSSEAYALKMQHVSKRFGGVQALDDVSIDVRVGEVHCLAGENGCGKSTLIKIVTGVYEPDDGTQIEVFGEQVTANSPTRARARGIAVIWQDLALFPHMTVAENIGFDELVGGRPKLADLKSIHNRAKRVMERLNVSLDLDAPLHTLPIAQRQVVAIARSLMSDARLIFMDEPTASLTQSETDALLAIVRNLSADGVAVVFVSHRLAEVLDIAERVTVVRDGKLIGVYPTEGMSQSRLGELMTGHTLETEINAQDRTKTERVLHVEGLTRRNEFEDVSFSIGTGEVVGLIGLIGAGRTELAHALIGMSRVDVGTIYLDGKAIRPRNIREAIRLGIAYVSEDRLTLGLVQPQSIADNTVSTVLDKILAATGLISSREKTDLVGTWIQRFAIKVGLPEDAVSTLSGGNQQRVVLAKWLATKPKLLILDSPTVGVDVGARAGIFKIVRELADEGLAILLITDEITEAYFNADRILHMADGRIRSQFDPHGTSVAALEEQVYA